MNCLKSNNRLRILTIYPRTQSCANMISIDTKFFDLLNDQRGLLFFFAAGINIEIDDHQLLDWIRSNNRSYMPIPKKVEYITITSDYKPSSKVFIIRRTSHYIQELAFIDKSICTNEVG